MASRTRKKTKTTIIHGQVHITATFNNTHVTFTNAQGEAIAWSSAGACGFKGSRKATPFAAQVAVQKAAEGAKANGLIYVDIFVSGTGPGREAALRMVKSCDLQIADLIKDVTPIPHNGVRPRKKRRV